MMSPLDAGDYEGPDKEYKMKCTLNGEGSKEVLGGTLSYIWEHKSVLILWRNMREFIWNNVNEQHPQSEWSLLVINMCETLTE